MEIHVCNETPWYNKYKLIKKKRGGGRKEIKAQRKFYA
jgi:hypothetical protein